MLCTNVLINATIVLLMNYPEFMARGKNGIFTNSSGFTYCSRNADAVEYGGNVYSVLDGYLYVFSLRNMSFYERTRTSYVSVDRNYDGSSLIFGLNDGRYKFASARKNYVVEEPHGYRMAGGYFFHIDKYFNLLISNSSRTAICKRNISLEQHREFFEARQLADTSFFVAGDFVVLQSTGSLRINMKTGEIKHIAITADQRPFAFGNQLLFFNTVDYRIIGGAVDQIGYGAPPVIECYRSSMRRFYVCVASAAGLLAYAFLLRIK